MIRATTPKHTFVFPLDPETRFAEILITYAQNGRVILNKHKSDLSFAAEGSEAAPVYTASLRLTQEETALFRPGRFGAGAANVTVQLRALDTDGLVFASEPAQLLLADVLNDEVLPCA